MELFLGFLLVLGAAGAGIGTLVWRDRSWQRVADRHGLHYESKSLFGERRLVGEVAGVPVEVSATRVGEATDNDRPRVTQFTAGEGSIPASVEASTEGSLRRLLSVFVTSDVEIGDREVDKRLRLQGDPLELSAVLSHEGRHALLKLLDDRDAQLKEGVLRSAHRGWLIRHQKLERHLEEVLHVATELSAAPDELPARLRHNALNDPVAEVRDTCAKLVMHHYPNTQEALDVADARRHHPDPEIAMLAALVMRDSESVVEMVGDRSLPAEVRGLGAHQLARFDRDRAVPLVRDLLLGKPGAQRLGACEAVADYALDELHEELCALAPNAKPEEALPILTTTARCGGPALAAALAWVLDKLDGAERDAAARLIDVHADTRALEPLAAMSKGALRGAGVKQTAKGLTHVLRQRFDLRERSGGLSVVEEQTGGLELVPGAADGALSPETEAPTTLDTAEPEADTEAVEEAG